MSKIDYEIDLLIEIERLNSLYLHYRNVYRKVCLFCNSNKKSVAKLNRDHYRDKLKDKRKELQHLRTNHT